MPDSADRSLTPIIAIGASAGGLEACRALMKDFPADLSAALVLVLHLDPSHDSMMVDLLDRHTDLAVVQAANGMSLRPGVLHVIPPGVFLTVEQNILHLSQPERGKSVRLPFDVLLRSMAQVVDTRLAGIILSGTGTDGTLGIADLHKAGGLIIAQDPDEAGYPGMPSSAIGTGLVAQTLRTDQMLDAVQIFLNPEQETTDSTASDAKRVKDAHGAPESGAYDDLLTFLGDHAAQDLSLYKRGTLERRIARRMTLIGLDLADTAGYLERLRADAQECAQLSADLLIHVTSFFRDPAVFDHLRDTAIPGLLKGNAADRPFRIWVAGCSTGEEAYGMAMVCLEAFAATGSDVRLQILASDVDPEAVATARAGFYPRDIESVVSAERLSRFFVAEDGGYRATSALRDVIVFTVADLLSDPPFSRIDLVSCRNVLIYLGPEAQKRVIARCCFALRRDGLLLLGAAEMPGPGDTCFAIEDKKSRLWRRVGREKPADLHFAIGRRDEGATPSSQTMLRGSTLAELCRKIVLDTYAPAAALLNTRLEVQYLLGPTEKYLKVTQGVPESGIVGMLPKVLRARFRTAVASCNADNPRVTLAGVRVPGFATFDIALHHVAAAGEPLLLVCFLDTPQRAQTGPANAGANGETTKAEDLEADLAAARSDLSDALRDLEAEVESHGADAAEALSVNEEFQSTNEELLASKEELQSLNEELTALNSQLQETLERHRTTANDLQNVLFSTDVATLFLDLNLNIRFFTPAARAIFRVIATDVGRPLADLAAVSKDDQLASDARKVLETGARSEYEIHDQDENWFLRCIQPYRAEGGQVEGVVITYTDITERKRSNAALVAAMTEAERATTAKSRFLASASHDLRQPLQSMALLHKLLSRNKRSSEGARLIALLDQTLKSMTNMLDSMLDVNRIDSGIIRPVLQPVAIAPLMQRLVDEFSPECGQKSLKLRSVPSRAWVQTDPNLLEQILRNLLANALKYTSTGGILMGCRRRGELLTIVVCDSGMGIEKSEIKSIFEAYRQGEKTAALTGPGLGLGLSIVQRLANLMEHPVSVRSTPGRGSAFMITLPVTYAPVKDKTESVAIEPEIPQTGTVLLVEDKQPLRDLLTEVLTNEGHTVISKSTAQEALTWAGGNAPVPDLLLTDFDLHGGVNGLSLANDLPYVLGGAVPTVILTGDITSETIRQIGATGFVQVVKPVLPEVLLAQISSLMQMARRERAAAPRRADAKVTTIVIIDDDPMIRDTTRRLFEAEGWRVQTHGSAEDFLAVARPTGSACLLLDNLLPGMSGVALITRLRADGISLPVVMLTGHGDAATAVAALKAGASDLIEKPASAADLLASLRYALAAKRDVLPQAATREAAQDRFKGLTARERDVLAMVLKGAPNKNIAADLGINQRTVENHRAAVMRKTGAQSLPGLVRLALVGELQIP